MEQLVKQYWKQSHSVQVSLADAGYKPSIEKKEIALKLIYNDDKTNISLWRLYNLFTYANRSSYIDNFHGQERECILLYSRVS